MLDIELALLNTQGKVQILSKPRIKTKSNHTATISSGTEVPYQTTNGDGDTAVSFRRALLELQITPHTIDATRLALDILLASDTVGDRYQGLPAIDVNSVQTKITMNAGETIVLGGIVRTVEQEKESKVPVLGDLPMLGFLFRYKEKTRQKWELMVALTPRFALDEQTETKTQPSFNFAPMGDDIFE